MCDRRRGRTSLRPANHKVRFQPDPVLTGSNITYSIVITNNGPATDLGGTFTDILPSGTTFEIDDEPRER